MTRRPPRPHTLRVQLADDELALIREAAGETMAEWARGLLLAQARRVTQGLPPSLDARPTLSAEKRAEQQIVMALKQVPRRPDTEIADALGYTVDTVRRVREAAGIEGVATRRGSGWQDAIRAAHGEGLTTSEIAARTGYTVRSVQQKLSELGLKAHRREK